MTNPEGLKALSQLILTVFRLNGCIGEWGDALGAPVELSTTRWQILGALDLGEESLTAPGIARIMGLSRQAVQKQLNILLQAGLVQQCRNPAHERSHLYRLSTTGKAAVKEIGARYATWLEAATQGMTCSDLQTAQAILQTLHGNIERIVPQCR